jgi:cobalt-zinc-cadmium efflux system membrane fusion protein
MKRLLPILPLLFLAACSPSPNPTVADAKSQAKEPEHPTENASFWSNKTELYLEYPVLVRGVDSRFAIHLTRLSDFKPVPAGRAEVRLTYGDGTVETFSTKGPSKAGIFGVTVKPARAGTATVEVSLMSPSLSDTHTLENVPVFASLAEVKLNEEPKEETIAFLKEQQWALDFATQAAGMGTLRESLRVPAEVTPRSGGEVSVTAPFAGRLTADPFPVLGMRVQQGQVLASMIPPTPVPSDRASLDLAMAEAEAALDYARRDKDRASRLVDAGAAPRKRLDETVAAERTAEARLRAAEERIRQFEASRNAEGGGSAPFVVRAPIAGMIVETMTSPGANLKGGDPLFKIIDTERIYVSAIVPEAEYPGVRSLTGAEIEIPGLTQPRPAGRLVSIGKVVDAASRTFPIVYEFNNTDGRIAINQTVTIRLFLEGARQGVTIPESALVDDGGRPIVFVQRKGEAFSRRPVDVGRKQSGLVEITSGVKPGERVVTKGAYLIRLSSMSAQIPAHGHVH